jgi:DNA repair protein RadC
MAAARTDAARRRREDAAIARAVALLEARLRRPDATALLSPDAVRTFLRLQLRDEAREWFAACWLDAQGRLLEFEVLAIGTLQQAVVHPREVVRSALALNASAVIFAHNHPSGSAEPSLSDRVLTNRLRDTLGLFEVAVHDHVVVGADGSTSFAERGLLPVRAPWVAPARRRSRKTKVQPGGAAAHQGE